MRAADIEKSKFGAYSIGKPSTLATFWNTTSDDVASIEKDAKNFFRTAQEDIKKIRKEKQELKDQSGYILYQDHIYQFFPNDTLKKITGDVARNIKHSFHELNQNVICQST